MSDLKEAFTSTFPDLPASAEARNRVGQMALEADRKRSVRRRMRLTFGIGLSTCAVAAMIVMAPGITTAAYIRHVGNLVKDAKSAHIVEWGPLAGGKRKIREMWYQDGRWRVETPKAVTIADANRLWVYSPERKSVRVSTLDHPFMGGNGFKMTSMLTNQAPGSHVTIGQQDGYKVVHMENGIDHGHITVWVDKNTDYPVRGQMQSETPHGPKTNGEFTCEFNVPLPAQKFAAAFPPDTKVIDTVGGERFWQKEFSKSLAKFDPGESGASVPTILRNVQVTESGDVYLLYSGALNADSFALTDDLGNQYIRCEGFQPQGYSLDQNTRLPRPDKGFRVDGGILNGGWWTPLGGPTGKWRPRKLTFTVTSTWYKADPEKMKRLPKGAMVPMTSMTRVDNPLGHWSLSVPEPTCGSMPDYMPYMAMGPRTEFDVIRQDENARYHYLLLQGRFAEAESPLRDLIRRVEEQEAINGSTWVKTSWYFAMYKVLKNTGRDAEARVWLAKVLDQPGGAAGDAEVERALTTEGL